MLRMELAMTLAQPAALSSAMVSLRENLESLSTAFCMARRETEESSST